MPDIVIVSLISLAGTLFGSIAGIMTANKLTTYRIGELEKKVEKHNDLVERVALLEQDNGSQWERIDELREKLDSLRREMVR